jgi:hypothetical protein
MYLDDMHGDLVHGTRMKEPAENTLPQAPSNPGL